MPKTKAVSVVIAKRIKTADIKKLNDMGINPADLFTHAVEALLRLKQCPCCGQSMAKTSKRGE